MPREFTFTWLLPREVHEETASRGTTDDRRLPPLLRASRAVVYWGLPASPGIGLGRAVRLRRATLSCAIPTEGEVDADAERARVDEALAALVADYDARIERLGPGTAADIVMAHRAVARDTGFRARIHEALASGRLTAAGAIVDAERHFGEMLARSTSRLLRERAVDVRDVAFDLLRTLYGPGAVEGDVPALDPATVVVADDLGPGEFLALDRHRLEALVLTGGSPTTHAVILARSFGIPTVVGVGPLSDTVLEGHDVLVDGTSGLVATGVDEAAARYVALERRRISARRARLAQRATEPAVTADGQRVEVGANIAVADEAEAAFGAGADAIGVFRTEMLFTGRDAAPSEEEHLAAYRRVIDAARGRRVTVRTLDAGGDKPLPFARLPREANPFLGRRAIRMYPGHDALVRDQVRAVLRAGASGRVELLLPFVTSLDEVRWMRQVVAEEQARTGAAAPPALGAMIEVPAVAFAIDHLAPLVDFFSIGTNDLLQFFAAADRGNARVAALYDPLSPAFLRFLHTIVQTVRANGRWIGLCGEMANDPACLPLLVGLGLDEVSVAVPHVGRVKHAVRAISAAACRDLLHRAMAAATAVEVRALLEESDCRAPAPLLTPDLVALGVECRGRDDALKLVADLVSVAGRTERPLDIEEALGRRESASSTSVGHGFAVPHCRSHAVDADSLVIVKLASPVAWGPQGDEAVHTIMALVFGEGRDEQHLRVPAALARRLTHEEFRAAILQAGDPAVLIDVVAREVGIPRFAGAQ